MRIAALVFLIGCTSGNAAMDAGDDASLDGDIDARIDVMKATKDASGVTVVIAAAGDISDDAIDHQKETSDLIVGPADGGGGAYDAVLLLGDNQYPEGASSDYMQFFDPTWGRFKPLIRPSPGNHDYITQNAAGYYGYFGAAAGDPAKGYYSFDLGDWHLIALNTNDAGCAIVPCNANSAQIAWLKNDLVQNGTHCTLAFWHHPRFNSGVRHGNFLGAQAIWDALYAGGTDVVLNGHEHLYERFDPQDPGQHPDPEFGIRQFTVGTGGAGFYTFMNPEPNSVVRQTGTYGVLKLTLKPHAYEWEFLAVPPSTFTDRGTGTCH